MNNVITKSAAELEADQKEVCAFNETNRNVRNFYFALLAVAVLTVAIDAVFIPNH